MRVINVFMLAMAKELDYASVLEMAGDWVADNEDREHIGFESLVAVSREA